LDQEATNDIFAVEVPDYDFDDQFDQFENDGFAGGDGLEEFKMHEGRDRGQINTVVDKKTDLKSDPRRGTEMNPKQVAFDPNKLDLSILDSPSVSEEQKTND
jgi:hypothetical protein